jgi:hypothetical protein
MVVAATTTSRPVAARMPELAVSMGTVAAFPLLVQPFGPAGLILVMTTTMSKPAVVRTPELAVARAPELGVLMERAPKLAEEKEPMVSYR